MTKVIIDAAKALDIIVHDQIIIGKNGHVGLKGLTDSTQIRLNRRRKTICNIDRLPIEERHFCRKMIPFPIRG
ncbi:hypothetical protein AMC87_CH01898 [Rhizobium phaseoli]|nr:hypothetical protein AMC87_CH01898 [Rhizobium phaseoli]KEC75415.1 DNA repair protein RadC [Rhizobium leguminosarum bv. phaseoli CCGM1]PDS72129.1 hypothetical protein CO651_09160 [Rhizobium phaseoli]PWI54347.1 hypothetical protein B5K03_09105 [Rhizobium phaseoli]